MDFYYTSINTLKGTDSVDSTAEENSSVFSLIQMC